MSASGSIICKLDVKTSRPEPTAYAPNSVFANAPATVLEKQAGLHSSGDGDPARVAERSSSLAAQSPFASADAGVALGGALCQWCMHAFDDPPVGIPIRKNSGGEYDTFGIFCSLECASAFNFDKLHASHTAFARHAMCCEIATMHSKQTLAPIKIRPAPPRETLRIFGGSLTIEEFRSKSSPYTIVYPLPVCSKQRYSESMTFASADVSGPRFVPIEDETIDSLTSGLRRPPVSKKGYRSTIDYMCAGGTGS